jgi:peptidyl-prolyl cis-trans isomerase C
MNPKIIGIALAVILAVAAVFGYGISQKSSNESPAEPPAAEADQAANAVDVEEPKKNPAEAEPAAGEAKSDEKSEAEVAPAVAGDDPVVAKVEGTDLHRSEVLAFIQNLPPQMRQVPPEAIFPMALEQVINGKIVDLKVAATDVSTTPAYATRLEDAKKQIARAVYVEGEIEKALSEADVKKAYDKLVKDQGKVEEVKARHILVEKEDQAKDIIKKIEGGAKFEDLAKEFSKDTSNKASGGDLGYFTKDSMVKEFAEAAFKLGKGETSKEPVKTQFGYHVIQVEDRRDRPAPKFEEVKPQLEAQVRRDLLNSLVEGWRGKAKVETFDFNGKPVEKKEAPKAEEEKK